MEEYHLGNYALLLLLRLVAKCTTFEGLKKAVEDYPEDTKREGNVRQHMCEYVSQFQNFAQVVDAINKDVAKRGGIEALEAERGIFDFDEFMAGWDEER